MAARPTRPQTAPARKQTGQPQTPAADAAPAARSHLYEAKLNATESMRRRVRQLELNNKDWQEQVQKDLRRQKIEIDSLKRDNEPLKTQVDGLRAAEATSSGGSSSGARQGAGKGLKRSKELDAKRETLAHLESRCSHQEARLTELKKRLAADRTKVSEARKKMGGVNIVQESNENIHRQISVLENRLDQSLVKFNDALRQNKELRDTIDTLRAERDVFDAIYLKLEAELQEKKKEMAFIIEVSNIAYEERDNNVQVLSNLKAFAAEELSSFTDAFKELDDLLEEDRRMKEQVKARLSAMERKEKAILEDDDHNGLTRSKKAAGSKNNQSKSLHANNTANDSTKEPLSQVQEYEEAFNRIRQATDIPDLDELVKRFLHSEEDNFSLFSYVNDLGKEIEALEKQRSELLDEIDTVTIGNAADQERRQELKVLEDQLRVEEQKNQKFIEMSQKTESILSSVMSSVDQIFDRLDCDDSAILEQHGVSGLTLETLLLYLAAIELRTEEYLAAWSRQTNVPLDSQVARGPQVAFDSMQVTVDIKKLPGTGEDATGSDDDMHPLTKDELIRKVQRRMQQGTQSYAGGPGRPVRSKHHARTAFGATPKKQLTSN